MSPVILKATLRLVDTAHFGTGQPFLQQDAGQAIADSLYPALPSTAAGCVRLALADALGASRGDWTAAHGEDSELVRWLGADGRLGRLSFVGPFFVERRGGGGRSRPLFTLPLDLHEPEALGSAEGASFESLVCAPATAPGFTDLSSAVTPTGTPSEPASGLMRDDDLQSYTDGKLPRRRRNAGANVGLAIKEWRTGLAREGASRMASQGMLYSQARQRPAPDTEIIVFGIDNEASEEPQKSRESFLQTVLGRRLVPLGADGGVAEVVIDRPDSEQVVSVPRRLRGARMTKLLLLTPALFAQSPRAGDELVVNGTAARIEFAFTSRPTSFGGWRSLEAGTGRSQPRRSIWAAGSVLVLATVDGRKCDWESPAKVGLLTEWGFGFAVLAKLGAANR